MATMQERVIQYMRDKYNESGQYKFSGTEVIDFAISKSPTSSRATISALISTLKSKDIIVDLKEQVPGGRKNQTYFALAEHLEEVTKPQSKPEEAPKSEAPVAKKEEVKPVTKDSPTSTKLPSQVAVNPFDKVNSQLGELLSKVNGLAKGYAELVERKPSSDVLIMLQAISDKIDNSEVSATSIMGKLDRIAELASKPIIADDKLADAINARLQDLTKEDSLIYRIREEVADQLTDTEQNILNGIKLPENFGTLSDEEKYQKGIKDGIRLAAEMGIILPDA